MNAPLPRAGLAVATPAHTRSRRRGSALPSGVTRREIALALLAIAALHVIVITALIRAGIIETPQVVQIIRAALVQPPAPEEPKPPTELPKPPQARKLVQPAPQPPKPVPVLAAAPAPNETPVAVAPPPEPKPDLPPIAAPPAPPAPPIQAATPPPVAPPRFDADYLDNPAPAYPSMARRMGEEGKVVLRVFVEASGKPAKIEVRTSSGSTRLDEAASAAVWRWKFVPARRGEETVAAWVLVPISFSLRDA